MDNENIKLEEEIAMKKTFKLISLLVAFVLLTGIFTACGRKDEAGSSTEKAAAEKKQDAESQKQVTESPKKDTKLVLYHSDATPVTNQIIAEFDR